MDICQHVVAERSESLAESEMEEEEEDSAETPETLSDQVKMSRSLSSLPSCCSSLDEDNESIDEILNGLIMIHEKLFNDDVSIWKIYTPKNIYDDVCILYSFAYALSLIFYCILG